MESDRILLTARYLKCIRCGNSMTRQQTSDAFYSCQGGETEKHPEILMASVFDTEEGILPRFVEPEKTNA